MVPTIKAWLAQLDRAPAYEAGGCRIVPYTTHQLMVSTKEITVAALEHYAAIKVLEKRIDEKLLQAIKYRPFQLTWQIMLPGSDDTTALQGLLIRYEGSGWLVSKKTDWSSSTKEWSVFITFAVDNQPIVKSRIRRAFYERDKVEDPEVKEGSRSIKVTLS